MKRLLLASALTAAPFALSPAMAATCTPASPTEGATVTCTGTAAGGLTSPANDLKVEVGTGAVIENTGGDAIRIRGLNNKVTNFGTIEGKRPVAEDGSDGIDGGHGLVVLNAGTITGTSRAIETDGKNDLFVSNSGTIKARHKAIRNRDGLRAKLRNTGLIESETHEGFETGDDALVENYGTIRASDDALQVGENVTIHNYGLIESVLRGGDEDDPQDGIDIDSGAIHNYAGAVIRSDDDAAIDYDVSVTASSITNHGTISGTVGVLTDPGNTAAQRIDNHGTIEGRDGIAVDLGAGDDELRLFDGAILLGDSLMGSGDDRLVLGSAITDLTAGLIDGGQGTNTVQFTLLNFAAIRAVSVMDQVMSISVLDDNNDFLLTLTSWASFGFADGDYSWAQMADLAEPAPVPLPAGALLLPAALAGLGVVARRRRNA
ncbi:VPLPA-CTERM sorting domain-containing protein [uncultured Paracoccus sp.]|uniref:VPLPA-CTERM sorting domain-containing protein n=1 Tax=uncultured Paracoccus sp. TaxID=189685 RepID=UPI0025E54AD6|nr:VPLPA-CTERM sorting domain-containing protein [uncultured Paracoccus sp.]